MTLRTIFGSEVYLTMIASAIALGGVACTIVTTDGTPTPVAPGGTVPGTDGGLTEPGPDGGVAADGGASSGAGNFGAISLSSNTLSVGTTDVNSSSASAFFSAATVGGTTTTTKCTTTTDGSCSVTECDTTPAAPVEAGAPVDAGTPPKPANAGAIDVTGGTIGAEGIELAVGETGLYTAVSGQTKLWAGGEDISVKAAGDTVPAFAQKVKAPSIVTLTEPTLPAAGQQLTVDRTKEMKITWTGGTSGDVQVAISGSAGNKLTSISCTFPASNSNGAITAAALGKLPVVSAAPDTGSFFLSSSSSTAFKQGDWTLSLSATSFGKAGSSYASAQLKIQ